MSDAGKVLSAAHKHEQQRRGIRWRVHARGRIDAAAAAAAVVAMAVAKEVA